MAKTSLQLDVMWEGSISTYIMICESYTISDRLASIFNTNESVHIHYGNHELCYPVCRAPNHCAQKLDCFSSMISCDGLKC
jgi:hypothetical protein